VVHSGAVPAVVHHAAAYNQECHTAAGWVESCCDNGWGGGGGNEKGSDLEKKDTPCVSQQQGNLAWKWPEIYLLWPSHFMCCMGSCGRVP
jgi:hypothetical protein